MMGEVRHTSYELKFCKPIETARGVIEKRRGFLFGVEFGGKSYVSEAALLPEFGTEYFEHAERVVQIETRNFLSAPATLFGMDCIRWVSDHVHCEGFAIPVAKLLRSSGNSEVWDSARQLRDEGFTSVKLKVGLRDVREDARVVRAIHEAAPELKLRLDVNCGWSASKITEFSSEIPADIVEWIEDPYSSSEWPDVSDGVNFTLACDEAFTPAQLMRGDIWRKFDVLVVKPERLGPVAELEQLCARAKAEGKKVVFSSMYASGVGLSIIAALALEYGSSDVAHGLGTSGVFEVDLLREPLEICEGRLLVPPLDELANLLGDEWREKLGFSAA